MFLTFVFGMALLGSYKVGNNIQLNVRNITDAGRKRHFTGDSLERPGRQIEKVA